MSRQKLGKIKPQRTMLRSAVMRVTAAVVCAGCVVLGLASPASGDTKVADLGGDYQATTPKTGWQYLKATLPSGGTETALTYGDTVGIGGNIGYGGGSGDGFNLPCVLGTNSSGNAFKIFEEGNAGVVGTDLLLHPANTSPAYVIMRYTISAADVLNGTQATISGSFRRANAAANGVDVYVFKNTTRLFTVTSVNQLTQAAGTFDLNTVVAAGDTISFALGNSIDYYGDESAVRGSIVLSQRLLAWTGDYSSEWSLNAIGGNKNWMMSGSAADFSDGSPVSFDDTATGTTVDVSVTDVSPLKMTFVNVTRDYTLQGSKAVAGPVRLDKEGSGTLTINNANTYSGGTMVYNGTLLVGNDSALGASTGELRVNGAGAALNLGGYSLALSAVALDSGVISNGNVTVGSFAATQGRVAAACVNISNGVFAVYAGAGTVNIESGGVVNITNGVFAVGASTVGTGTMNIESGAVVNVVNGDHACSTYLGGQIDNAGAGGKGVLNLNGGTLNLPSGGTADAGDGSCFWLNAYSGGSGSTINLNAGVLNTARPIANGNPNPAIFNFNGGTFRSTYTDGLAIKYNPMALNVRDGGAVIDTDTGAVSIDKSFAHSPIGGDNAIDGGLVKLGAGTLALSGANTYSGLTSVSNGTLLVNGPHMGGSGYRVDVGAALGGTGTVALAVGGTVEVLANATLVPGAATGAGGTLTLSALTMASAATLAIDDPADRVVVTGALTLDATAVTVSNLNLFDKAVAYPILTCDTGPITGTFKVGVNDPRWNVKQSGSTFYLRYNQGTLIRIF